MKNKAKRILGVSRETLRRLDALSLAEVAGGGHTNMWRACSPSAFVPCDDTNAYVCADFTTICGNTGTCPQTEACSF